MTTEHPANYLTIFTGDGDAIQATLDQVLDTMKEQLGGESPSTLTVSSGSITPTNGAHAVDAGTSGDLSNIDTINLMEGQLLLLWPAEGSEVTVKHQAGGVGEITLRDGADVVLNAPDKYVLLQRLEDDWQEAGHLGNIVDPADMKRLEAVREGVTLSRDNDVLDLNKGAVKIHEEAGGADHTVSGTIVTMTAAADLVGTLAFGDICYVDSSGKLKKADADTVATTTSVVMAMETMTADDSGSVLLRGFVRDDSWSWTAGGVVYASDTEGGLTQTPGSGAVLGIATSATRMHFTPDKTLTTRQLWMDEDAGGADLTASGAITSMVAGQDLLFGDLCYVDVNGQMQKVNAFNADANPVEAMALATITNGNSGTFLVRGFVRDDSWSWTKGGVVYATGTTGGLTQSDASGPVVGVATDTNLMHFTPDKTLSTRQVRLNKDAGGADHTASGTTVTLTVGETGGVSFGDVCYLDSTTGTYKKADKENVATIPGIVMALETITNGNSGMFLLRGFVRDDSWSWTTGAVIYGSATVGGLSQAASTGAVLGVATSATHLHFTPDKAVVSQQLAMEVDEEAGGTDHTASGITVVMTAGENLDEDDLPVDLVFGDVCYVGSDGKLTKATAHIATDTPVRAMALETIEEDDPGKVLLTGFVRDDSWDWTTGGLVYLSAEAGQLTQTKPTGSGEMIQAVGVATHADRIFFDPNSCFTRNDGELRGVSFYPYEVEKSCLFEGTDSTYLSRTFTSDATWTFSIWVKRVGLGAVSPILHDVIYFNASDQLVFCGTTSTPVFRDPGQWLHIVVNSTAGYVNGVSFGAPTTMAALVNKNIGYDGTQYLNAYLAEVHFCDGQNESCIDFGEDTNGVWTPKQVTAVAYGTDGYHLDFQDSANLGDDVSGNTNHWTKNNITAANQSMDAPTNNWCTLNPLYPATPGHVVGGPGNLVDTISALTYFRKFGTLGVTSGKWYYEMSPDYNDAQIYAGWGTIDASNTPHPGGDGKSCGWCSNGYWYGVTHSESATGVTWGANDVAMLAIDVDAQKFWVGLNGVWAYSGNPSAGTGEANTTSGWFDTDKAIVPISSGNQSGTNNNRFNFGGTDIIGVSSGNADDNGYGNFEYAPPTGFMALCSANMPEPTVGECADDVGFVVTTDTYSNIVTSLETLRSGWTSWIDVFKCNTANSDWRVRFSDDSSNQLALNLSDDKTAFVNPSDITGTWEAWSWRVGAEYGCVTDTINHTNGSDSTGAHGLGATPEMCITKPEDQNSTDWYCYNKTVAAGNNILLNSNAAQTATEYVEVGATNVTIKSAAPTGVYRYIAFVGVDGMSYFGSYEGNNNADGPFTNTGFSPAFTIQKNMDVGTTRWVYTSNANDNGNVLAVSGAGSDSMYVDTNGYHTGGFDQDHLSNGLKIRINGAGDNYTNSLHTFILMAWAAQPFKYANAR